MVILLFLVGGTMKTLPNIFQNTFYLTELYLSNMLIFLKLCSFIKKKENNNILNQDVQKSRCIFT